MDRAFKKDIIKTASYAVLLVYLKVTHQICKHTSVLNEVHTCKFIVQKH